PEALVVYNNLPFETESDKNNIVKILDLMAPEYFLSYLDKALENLPGVSPVWDDILIYGEGDTVEEAEADHDRKLISLFDRCKAVSLKNEDYCKHLNSDVKFVEILSNSGIPSQISLDHKLNIIQSIIIHYAINKRKVCMDQFRDGLRTLDVLKSIEKYPKYIETYTLIEKLHRSHLGIEGSLRRACESIYWL
ncbi:hypothetical protein QZH41_016785, partial [Actinostola sp. cb2023]